MARVATQRNEIRKHLRSGWSITPIQALQQYGCFRLAAVVHYLRDKEGLNIKTTMVSDRRTGKAYAKYHIPMNLESE